MASTVLGLHVRPLHGCPLFRQLTSSQDHRNPKVLGRNAVSMHSSLTVQCQYRICWSHTDHPGILQAFAAFRYRWYRGDRWLGRPGCRPRVLLPPGECTSSLQCSIFDSGPCKIWAHHKAAGHSVEKVRALTYFKLCQTARSFTRGPLRQRPNLPRTGRRRTSRAVRPLAPFVCAMTF